MPAWIVFCSSRSVSAPRQVDGVVSPGTGKKNVLKVGPGSSWLELACIESTYATKISSCTSCSRARPSAPARPPQSTARTHELLGVVGFEAALLEPRDQELEEPAPVRGRGRASGQARMLQEVVHEPGLRPSEVESWREVEDVQGLEGRVLEEDEVERVHDESSWGRHSEACKASESGEVERVLAVLTAVWRSRGDERV